MTTSKLPTLTTYFSLPQTQQDNNSSRCTLKWRQGQLLVSLEQRLGRPDLPSLENKQWLVECLKHSSVRLVRIDPNLGEASLKFWADACEQASKTVFLCLSPAQKLHNQQRLLSWGVRLIDWSAAALLLLVLSPFMLGLAWLMRVQSPEPIFLRQWCVGKRGKLFRLFKFRTLVVNAQTLEQEVMGNQNLQNGEDEQKITSFRRWMRKYKLDQLPQLFNVLRGEMNLRGPRPLSLYEAVREAKKSNN